MLNLYIRTNTLILLNKQQTMALSRIKVESGIQLLARLTKKGGIENFYPILFGSGPKYDDFIELYTEGSANSLLIELICEALIPAEFGGPEASVLIFNTDGNLSFDLITNLLRKKIITHMNFTDDCIRYNINDINTKLESILKNLYLLEIFNATEFYISIQNLENVLAKHANISLVIFHTLTAFYWSEQDYKLIKMDSYLKKLLGYIQKVIKEHRITVLYSRPEYFSSTKAIIDKLEPCCQNSTQEQINYRIQILYNEKDLNVLNVQTYENQFIKQFTIINDEIKWM